MWLLRILTCFAYARRTSWPDRPTAGHNSSASGVRLHLSIGGAKAIVDADIASSIQPNARAVIASSISWATRFSTPGFLRLISCNVSAAPSSYVLLLPFRAARR